MKRSQLKALVKECVREIILEEGLLKTIVTEVAEGLNAGLVVSNLTRCHAEIPCGLVYSWKQLQRLRLIHVFALRQALLPLHL